MSARHERWVDENALQHELRDLICLAVVADHLRWVLTDDDELGDWLAEAAREWRRLGGTGGGATSGVSNRAGWHGCARWLKTSL